MKLRSLVFLAFLTSTLFALLLVWWGPATNVSLPERGLYHHLDDARR